MPPSLIHSSILPLPNFHQLTNTLKHELIFSSLAGCDFKCGLEKNSSTFKLLGFNQITPSKVGFLSSICFILVCSCHMSRDSSLSMDKSTNPCQKLICSLKPHAHVFKHIVIGQNYSIWIIKRFNRFKTLP